MGWTQVGTIGGAAGGSGGGGSGPQGSRGNDGATWLMGTTPPSLAQGKVGDMYFQNAPLGGGAILIPGPQGPAGSPGVGSPGPSGLNVGSDGGLWTPPVAANWTASLVNSAKYTATAGKCLSIYAVATSTDQWSFATTPIPAVVPYSCIFYLKPLQWLLNDMAYGVFWRNSAANTFKTLGMVFNSAVSIYPVIECGLASDGTASIDSDYFVSSAGVNFIYWNWFKLTDDGTNQTYNLSVDGVNWWQAFSHARNTDVTANQVGFFTNVRNSSVQDSIVTLWSYTGG